MIVNAASRFAIGALLSSINPALHHARIEYRRAKSGVSFEYTLIGRAEFA